VNTLLVWATIGPAIAAVVAIIGRLLLSARRMFDKVDEFIDDWRGTPARPGVSGRSGVMERLDNIEHQLKPNSGESLRDAVNRIEVQVNSQSPSGN
jgi:hypothetical protein